MGPNEILSHKASQLSLLISYYTQVPTRMLMDQALNSGTAVT